MLPTYKFALCITDKLTTAKVNLIIAADKI